MKNVLNLWSTKNYIVEGLYRIYRFDVNILKLIHV